MSEPSPQAQAAARLLKSSGVVPKTKLRLRTVTGAPAGLKIAKPQLKKTAEEKAQLIEDAAAIATAQAAADAEYEKQMAEYEKQMAEYNKQAETKAAELEETQAKQQAQAKADEEAAAIAQAEAEAKAQAASVVAQAEAQLAIAAAQEAKAEATAMAQVAAAAQAALAEAEAKAQAAAATAANAQHSCMPATTHIAHKQGSRATPIIKPTEDDIPSAPAVPAALPSVGLPKISLKLAKQATKESSTKPKTVFARPKASNTLPKPITKSNSSLPKSNIGKAEKNAQTLEPNTDGASGKGSQGAFAEQSADYIATLQQQADATPLWKKPIFSIVLGVLLLAGGGTTYYVIGENAKTEAVKKQHAVTEVLLRQAENINKEGVETYSELVEKKIQISSSIKDAKLLMDVIVNPFQKNEYGKSRFGNAPIGVAQNACLLIGILAEKDPQIEKLVLNSLNNDAKKMNADLYDWLIQRVAVADIEGINDKLIKLASLLDEKENFKDKSAKLSSIWSVIGMRATEKNIPEILALINNPDTKGQLIGTLATCLDNITDLIDNEEELSKIGDALFEGIPEKIRPRLISTFAKTKSPKALEYYSERLKNEENWLRELIFLSAWGDDSQLPTLINLEKAVDKEAKNYRLIIAGLNTALAQNRERKTSDVRPLISTIYDKIEVDTSGLNDLVAKTDPDAAAFIGEDNPQLAALKEQRKVLEISSRQKLQLLRSMSSLREYPWVIEIISEYLNNGDEDVAIAAKQGLERIKKNSVDFQEMSSSHREKAGK